MIDSHCHLNRPEFDADRDAVLAAAERAGITGMMNVGYDLETSRASIGLAAAHPRILATVGIHPHDAALIADPEGRVTSAGAAALEELAALAVRPGVAAIGEIGLDYYRDLSPRPAQATAMRLQLELAERLELPVVFHVRDAWDEAMDLIDAVGVPSARGVLHAYGGHPPAVAWARERGLLLGIGGPVTYRNSALPAAVAAAGLDLLILETDAPWLPPVPHRGRRNEPAYLAHICEAVAGVLAADPATVAARTTANFEAVFRDDRNPRA